MIISEWEYKVTISATKPITTLITENECVGMKRNELNFVLVDAI